MHTQRLSSAPGDLARAAEMLRAGQTVAFSTETVYGLGADARNGSAVAAVFAAKGRPSFNPLIVHVADILAARSLVQWSDTADRLAAAFWPGALSLVLPVQADSGISSLVTTGLDTLAVRVPTNPVARHLLAAFDGPIAAPSANPSGRISPTTADHVMRGLDGQVAAIVDGGPCDVGLESTIIGLGDTPSLLRPGGLPAEVIEAALGETLRIPISEGEITVPGQSSSHYAPGATVRLNAEGPEGNEVYLSFGSRPGDRNLSPAGDLVEAAARLFDALHALDATGRPIAVAPIPEAGLGLAINDRLRRASAPRG
ncbi:MAG: threonylcarbamoyl-AMP synthase [Rhodobacteraceae bacterium]|nr:threonylcarbamoyl-AMP synthase [Paracoccaceae bacterium]